MHRQDGRQEIDRRTTTCRHGEFFSTVKIELADRFASLSEAKMELFDYIEVFTTDGAGIRRSARSVPAAFERCAAAA